MSGSSDFLPKLQQSNDVSDPEVQELDGFSPSPLNGINDGSKSCTSDSITPSGAVQKDTSASRGASCSSWTSYHVASRSNTMNSSELSRTNNSNPVTKQSSRTTQSNSAQELALLKGKFGSRSSLDALYFDLATSSSLELSHPISDASLFGESLLGDSVSELPSEDTMLTFLSQSRDDRYDFQGSDRENASSARLKPPPPPVCADDNAVDYDISFVADEEEEDNVPNECSVSPDLFSNSGPNEGSTFTNDPQSLHLHFDISEGGDDFSRSMTEKIFAGDFSNG